MKKNRKNLLGRVGDLLLSLLLPTAPVPQTPSAAPSPFLPTAGGWKSVGLVVELVAAALSTRERKVAEVLLEAKGDREIAQRLGIPLHEVKRQLKRMWCRAGLLPDLDRVRLALLLMGIDRRGADLGKNRLRFRPELLQSFRKPGRPVGVRDLSARNRLVKMGRDREDGTPAKMVLTTKQSHRLASSLIASPAEITPPLSADLPRG